MESVPLLSGHSFPVIGFGTWPLKGEECKRAVRLALDVGYTHFDTAVLYENHIAFGEANAILAGDGLATLAFLHLTAETPDWALAGRLTRELAKGTLSMIRGQVDDIHWEGRVATAEVLQSIHENKTAALFRCATRCGAMAAKVDEEAVRRCTIYGQSIGLAFQVVDDLLDVLATSEQIGKRAGKDLERGKNTYPGLFGIEESRARAVGLVQEAVEQIENLPGSDRLIELARYIIERTT